MDKWLLGMDSKKYYLNKKIASTIHRADLIWLLADEIAAFFHWANTLLVRLVKWTRKPDPQKFDKQLGRWRGNNTIFGSFREIYRPNFNDKKLVDINIIRLFRTSTQQKNFHIFFGHLNPSIFGYSDLTHVYLFHPDYKPDLGHKSPSVLFQY